MKAFKHPNLHNKEWRCPICKTREDKEVVLIGILGTESGNNIQAEQFHLDCVNLTYDKNPSMIYQKI